RRHPEVALLFPVHLNPNVRAAVAETLDAGERVILTDPLPYDQFLSILRRAYLLVTDSGGIQEEAAALGKPVLVVRDTTERMESVRTGTSKLVGRRREDVTAALERLLADDAEYQRMASAPCPYGDGRAAERIVAILRDRWQAAARIRA
ncbi:MAG: UDP-N-acetylglucosamine 2-epimerase (non-hydrolyzing), partial [Candidatus Dadabacteria bacterium]